MNASITWDGSVKDGKSFQAWVIEKLASGGDPITRMQNIGHAIIDTGYALVAAEYGGKIIKAVTGFFTGGASVATDAATDAASSAASGSSTAAGVGGFMSSLLWALGAAGVFLAFVIPMIPYILMLFSVMSWFTSVFIAMIAAPLWAISHATPDGHEAFGSGSNGYILLMSITLRPVLTIIAMFGSMAILFGIDSVFIAGFSVAIDGGQTNSAVGPIGFIVAIVMYCIISVVLVYSAYSLVQKTPDAILKWIGGSDDDAMGAEGHHNKVQGMLITARTAGSGAVASAKAAKMAGMQSASTKAAGNTPHQTGDAPSAIA